MIKMSTKKTTKLSKRDQEKLFDEQLNQESEAAIKKQNLAKDEEEKAEKLRLEFDDLEKKIRAHEEEIRIKYKDDYDRYSELFGRFTIVD
jgi:hypothetical protein